MRRRDQPGPGEPAVSLSFVDVLSCGFGAMIFVFLVFSMLPHMTSGSAVPAARMDRKADGERSNQAGAAGKGLTDEGSAAPTFPPLLVQLELPVSALDAAGTGTCDERRITVNVSKLEWSGPVRRTVQTIVDCEQRAARVQVLWESYPASTVRVTIPNDALGASSASIRLSTFSAAGSSTAVYELASDRPSDQQTIETPLRSDGSGLPGGQR